MKILCENFALNSSWGKNFGFHKCPASWRGGRIIFRKAGLSGKQAAPRIGIVLKTGQFGESRATNLSAEIAAIPVHALQFLLPDL